MNAIRCVSSVYTYVWHSLRPNTSLWAQGRHLRHVTKPRGGITQHDSVCEHQTELDYWENIHLRYLKFVGQIVALHRPQPIYAHQRLIEFSSLSSHTLRFYAVLFAPVTRDLYFSLSSVHINIFEAGFTSFAQCSTLQQHMQFGPKFVWYLLIRQLKARDRFLVYVSVEHVKSKGLFRHPGYTQPTTVDVLYSHVNTLAAIGELGL